MRQVFLDKGSLAVQEMAQPLLQDQAVLVLVSYSFIGSDTDIATVASTQTGLFDNVPRKVKMILDAAVTSARARRPSRVIQSLGYSCTGQVIATGKKVTHVRPGDFVACAGAGYAHHADLAVVPDHLVTRLSSKELLKKASVATVGSAALHSVRRAKLQLGDRVAVIGLGLLGQLIVQCAKKSGCRVLGTDVIPERIADAYAIGADRAFHASNDDVLHEAALFTQHSGFDVTIIAVDSASNDLVQRAMEITRRRGRVIIAGDIGLSIHREPFHEKEIDLSMVCAHDYMTRAYTDNADSRPGRWSYEAWSEQRNMQEIVSLIENNELHVNLFTKEEATLNTLDEAYVRIKEKQTYGVVLSCVPETNQTDDMRVEHHRARIQLQTTSAPCFVPAQRETVRVGVIGVGRFAKDRLMPALARMRGVSINALADPDATNVHAAGKLYNAASVCTSDLELLSQDCVDAVVIASPHRYHARQALSALRAGKAVFVEKPLVTDEAELEEFSHYLKANPHAPLCVDFNRSVSPFIMAIKGAVAKRQTPLMMHYRINSSFLPREHWIHSELGAGRIIGDACSLVDIFCLLVEAEPLSVSVEAIRSSRDDVFPTDNFVAHISFHDGSVCSLMYTALGNHKAGTERLEVYFDGKSIVMDDYTGLYSFGLSTAFNQSVATPEFGHEQLLAQFVQAIQINPYAPPLPFDRLLLGARLTLAIDQLVLAGGGTKRFAAHNASL